MLGHFTNNPSFPSTKPNSSFVGESKSKDHSMILKNRSCNTPEQNTNNLNLYFMDKFWSEKHQQSSSQGPSRRHHSFINQTYASPEDFYLKENICPSSNRNYRRYLAGFERLDENPSDEERTCNEITPQNSFFNDNDDNSSNTSEYNIQMEDSFYKRFSDLKLRAPNVRKAQEVELESEREKSNNIPTISYQLTKYQNLLQTKKALVKFQNKEDPKSLLVNQSLNKKGSLLPFQPHKANPKVNESLNFLKKAKTNRDSIVDKENKKPLVNQTIVPPKNIQGTYEDILKKYLNKKCNPNPVNTSSAANLKTTLVNTAKAPINIPSLLKRPETCKPNTNRASNKTLLIGTKESARILEETPAHHQREISKIPTEPSNPMRMSLANKAKTLSEVIYNHTKKRNSPMRKSSVNKTLIRTSPLKTLTDRSMSNPKNRVKFPIGEPVIIEPKALKDIRFDQILGQGAYAVVKLALDKHSGKQVAVKTYEKSKLQDPARMRNVRREISLLKGLEHTNIIKLHSSIETPKQIHLVMEYIGKVSLQSYLKSKITRRLEENEAKKIFIQLCKGISYCHSKSICHRDIKLDNILLDSDSNVKIIDFGFSICVAAEKKLGIFCGTPCYMAPEIVSKLQYYGPPTDVWALGIVLYALLCGKFPFRGFDEKDLFSKIKKGKYDVPSHLSKGACDLIEKVLCIRPEIRVTVDEILEDSWLRSE